MPHIFPKLERFPPKLLDFGDKEALQNPGFRAFLPGRIDSIRPGKALGPFPFENSRSTAWEEFVCRCRDCADAGMYSLENFVQPKTFVPALRVIDVVDCPDSLAGKSL